MSSRDHRCSECGVSWHCEGCRDESDAKVCDECKAKVAAPTLPLEISEAIKEYRVSCVEYTERPTTATRDRFNADYVALESAIVTELVRLKEEGDGGGWMRTHDSVAEAYGDLAKYNDALRAAARAYLYASNEPGPIRAAKSHDARRALLALLDGKGGG